MMNMVSNINLNFSFLQPLSFWKAITKDNVLGKTSFSFLYDTQSLILSYLSLFLFYKLIIKLTNRMQNTAKPIVIKIRSFLLVFVNGFNSIIQEMYFQQRIMIYFAFFQFILEFKNNRANYMLYLLSFFDLLEVIIFMVIDHIFVRKYIHYLTQSYEYEEIQPIVSLQFELISGKENTGLTLFQFNCMAIQIICPLIVAADVYFIVTLALLGFLFLNMALVIIISRGSRFNKRMMICFMANYFVLALFSILLCVIELVSDEKTIKIIGYILSGLIILPTVLTAIMYIPQVVSSVRSSIMNAVKSCKTKSNKKLNKSKK